MQLHIRKFDPSTIKPHRIVMIIGRRGTGKSILQRDLMYHQSGRVDFGVAMSPTEEAVQTFRAHMPDAWIYRQFQPDKIDEIIRIQRKALQSGKEPKHLFLVLDDCMYDKKAFRTKAIRDIFMNGRHLRISLSMAAQYMLDLPPDLRTQIDYVIVTRDVIQSNKLKLYKYFFGMFEKFEDFSRTMDRCTENFSVMVMDNTMVRTTNIEDCTFWYRARLDLPPFKMGKDVFWRLSAQYEKTDHQRKLEDEHREQMESMQKRIVKTRAPLIVNVTDERGNPLPSNDVMAGTSSPKRIKM